MPESGQVPLLVSQSNNSLLLGEAELTSDRNEMHLGPSAHRLMGTEVYHGIEQMWLR